MKRQGVWLSLITLAAVAGCSGNSSAAKQSAAPKSSGMFSTTQTLAAPPLTAEDRQYLQAATLLVPGVAKQKLITFGYGICANLDSEGAKDAETDAAQNSTGLSTTQIQVLAFAAARSYCPDQKASVVAENRRANKSAPPPKPQKITYKVFGNGSESSVITYTVDDDIEQDTDASLPWHKKINPGGTLYQLSAQDADGTSITCEIIDTDGAVLDKKTSHGEYAIASCMSSE